MSSEPRDDNNNNIVHDYRERQNRQLAALRAQEQRLRDEEQRLRDEYQRLNQIMQEMVQQNQQDQKEEND